MQKLTLGVIGASSKTDEKRLPIHPLHLERIDADLLARMHFETGYGVPFGVSDQQLTKSGAGIRSRAEIMSLVDVALLPKPQSEDLAQMRPGQILWGWPHCVQDAELTQRAIDRKLTLIAFEAMNYWTAEGWFSLHVFHKNNELAGYSSVLHALHLHGSTGHYGRRMNAVVIGFGATARGAVTALNALGIHDVHVVTQRGVTAVGSPIHSAEIVQMDQDSEDATGSDTRLHVTTDDDGRVPLAGFLTDHDIIVNCVLQDPNSPQMFLEEEDLTAMAPGSLIVDVSCDEGMGFSWALPTTFADPTFTVGENIRYYAVDHSPSYLWDAATWEISEALLPFLPTVLEGPAAWDADSTLRKAIEIRDGVIVNPDILAFQHRGPEYPHANLS